MTRKLPAYLSNQVPPAVKQRVLRWVELELRRGKESTASPRFLQLLAECSRQLAAELEFNYTPEEVQAISPEALEVLRDINVLFAKLKVPVPEEVTHVLGLHDVEGPKSNVTQYKRCS